MARSPAAAGPLATRWAGGWQSLGEVLGNAGPRLHVSTAAEPGAPARHPLHAPKSFPQTRRAQSQGPIQHVLREGKSVRASRGHLPL